MTLDQRILKTQPRKTGISRNALINLCKMPTKKESIYFSRILHHNLNALNDLTQHQPTNHFSWEHLVTQLSNFAD